MSLKAFHIVFIVASTLLALGFGLWSWREYQHGAGTAFLASAVIAWAAAVGLLLYGRWFLAKLKEKTP